MHTNRLAGEKSPYLLQHAHNPVDWFPWGDEAFEKAAREDKPIFLSIGYSTCHWCHVMERESFETEEIAEILNRSFVSIKVDREERPDVDRVYMTFVQATTGSGGWPMSVWLTPERKPFFGGTYFPPDNRYNRPGFRSVLEHIARAWSEDRGRIVESSDQIVSQLAEHTAISAAAALPDVHVLDHAFHTFRRMFDARLGGFGGAPKFPRPSIHNFLVRYYARAHNREALDMVLLTLREMAKGGMHDQLGGGFHRYSVDERWFVPHFEKMLYDQAQLAISYLEAYQITHDESLAAVARDILDYVLRDMTHPEGGFYSAEDADSVIDPAKPEEKGEGAFYIWSFDELSRILEPPVRDWFCFAYGVERDGNVVNDPQGEFTGKNILFQDHTVEETAEKFGFRVEEVRSALKAACAKLLAERSKRVRPHLDDKILTGWNALMISAFAKAAQILDDSRYRDAAVRAADFILKKLYEPETGTLRRRFREGEAAIDGFLDDYAFFAQALLDLYETVFQPYYLELAVYLAGVMIERFEDTQSGGLFSTADGEPDLIVRMKDDYDGAEPSGNSVAADVFLRLARITDRPEFAAAADRIFRVFGSRLQDGPAAVPQMLAALLRSLSPSRQVVIVGDANAQDTQAMLRAARSRFIPELAVLLADSDDTRDALGRYAPAIGEMRRLNGQATAYVCENYACQLPTTEIAELNELLQ